MASLKAALAAMTALAVGAVVAAWTSSRAVAMAAPGVELPFPWLAALVFANWFVRLEPWLATFGVGGAAAIGAMLSRGTTIRQERQVLLGWLAIAVCCSTADYVPASRWRSVAWIMQLALLVGFGMVSMVASVIVAAHLQNRMKKRGARIGGWHVVGASAVLCLLGPALFLVPVAVWVQSGRTLRQDDGAG